METYERKEKAPPEGEAKAHLERPEGGTGVEACAEETLSTAKPPDDGGLKPASYFLAEWTRLNGMNCRLEFNRPALNKMAEDGAFPKRPQLAGSDRHDLGGSRGALCNSRFLCSCQATPPSESPTSPTDDVLFRRSNEREILAGAREQASNVERTKK